MDLAKAKQVYDFYDEMFVDPPEEIEHVRAYSAVRELLGLVAGLLAAVEAASVPVSIVNNHNST